MADDNVRVATDGSGKRIDNESFTRAADTIYRQRVALGGSEDVEQVKVINSDPGASEYGVVVRNLPSGTQPVSAASLPLPAGAATSAAQTTGNTSLATLAGAVAGTEFQVDVIAMPAVDTELPAAAVLADNTVNPTTPSVGALNMVYDGATWDRARGDSTDGALVNLGANNDVTVTGTVTANAGSGPFPVSDNAGSLTVDAPIGTPVNVQIGDGTRTATVRDTGASDSLNVAIVDASGAQVTSFGGGTQYNEADVDATITGTAVLWEDTSDTLRAVSAAKPLPVNVVAGGAGDGSILDGVSAAIKATVLDYTNSNPLAVRLTDTSGDYIAAGGGTQYTEGDTDASITGGAVLMEGAANTLVPLQGTAADGVLVNLGGNNDVTVASLPLPAGASTFAEQQTQTTHLGTIAADTTDIETAVELIDDTVATLGTTTYTEAATKGLIVGAVRRDADTTLVDTTNEVGPLQMNAAGQLKVEAFSGEPLPVTLTSTTITGTVAATQSGTWNVNNVSGTVSLPTGAATQTTLAAVQTSVELIDDTIKVLGTDTYTEATTKGTVIGAVRRDAETSPVGTDNEIGPLTMDALGRVKVAATLLAGTTNIGDVDVLTVPAPLNLTGNGAAASALRVTLANDSTGTAVVTGAAAHASPVSGNPNLVAGRASTAVPTDVGADGDVASIWTNRNGAPVVTNAPHVGLIGSPWDLNCKGAQYTSTQTSTVLQAGGASEKIVVTKIQIQAYATTAFDLQVYFGTGAFARGTNRAIFDGTFKPSSTLAPGVVDTGPWISGTNGDDVLVTTSAAGSVTITIWFYLVT
jgi:hypothetical protein